MDHNKFAVPGKMDIDLDGVGELLPREADRGQRVLRRVMRSAAMSDDFHTATLGRKVGEGKTKMRFPLS